MGLRFVAYRVRGLSEIYTGSLGFRVSLSGMHGNFRKPEVAAKGYL